MTELLEPPKIDQQKKFDDAFKAGVFDPDTIYEVPMDLIYSDDAFNVRGPVQPASVFELAKEIQAHGLIQPITLQFPFRLIPEKWFRIVAGYRRFKAHQVNNAPVIRTTVKMGLTDLDARAINLIENTQRVDLNIVQEAKGIQPFVLAGWTQEEIAQKVGKSRGWAQTRVQLLDLPNECLDAAEAGELTQSDIKELWGARTFGYDVQMTMLKKIRDDKQRGKVRQTKAEKVALKRIEKKVRTPTEVFAIQESIQDVLGNSCLAAKALAWQQGLISNEELFDAITLEARHVGRIYEPPDGM